MSDFWETLKCDPWPLHACTHRCMDIYTWVPMNLYLCPHTTYCSDRYWLLQLYFQDSSPLSSAPLSLGHHLEPLLPKCPTISQHPQELTFSTSYLNFLPAASSLWGVSPPTRLGVLWGHSPAQTFTSPGHHSSIPLSMTDTGPWSPPGARSSLRFMGDFPGFPLSPPSPQPPVLVKLVRTGLLIQAQSPPKRERI